MSRDGQLRAHEVSSWPKADVLTGQNVRFGGQRTCPHAVFYEYTPYAPSAAALRSAGADNTVFPGHLHKSAIKHVSHNGRRATQT